MQGPALYIINNSKPLTPSFLNDKGPGESSNNMQCSQLEIQEISWKLGNFPRSAVGNTEVPR